MCGNRRTHATPIQTKDPNRAESVSETVQCDARKVKAQRVHVTPKVIKFLLFLHVFD